MRSLADMIKGHEGLRLKVYDDATGKEIKPGSLVVGHPTIGWGRALDTNGISIEEAQILLNNNIAQAMQEARYLFAEFDELTPARQHVLLSMFFNLGLGGVMKFKGMIQAIHDKNWELAADHMLNSLWAKQVKDRAVELARIMRTGSYPASH